MTNNLAIIIPAYKTNYLGKVFQCLKAQTCKDFNLYVVDDASPYDVKGCFKQYFHESEHVRFHRFADNIGGKNLSLHWKRCLSLLGNEEWVWLFSDDDLMSPDCVESFYKYVDHPNVHDVMRFTLNGTSETGDAIQMKNPTTSMLTCEEFFSLLYSWKIDARMPEFVLRKSKLMEIGGFVPYDLAWRSDNATVMKMAYPAGIFIMPEGVVTWRYSSVNISGRADYNKRKNDVTVQFFNWVDDFFKEHALHYHLSDEELMEAYGRSFLPEQNTSLCVQLIRISSELKHINNDMLSNLFFSIVEDNQELQGRLLAEENIRLRNESDYLASKCRKYLNVIRIGGYSFSVVILLMLLILMMLF